MHYGRCGLRRSSPVLVCRVLHEIMYPMGKDTRPGGHSDLGSLRGDAGSGMVLAWYGTFCRNGSLAITEKKNNEAPANNGLWGLRIECLRWMTFRSFLFSTIFRIGWGSPKIKGANGSSFLSREARDSGFLLLS